jgi:pyruvate/2-oxoacid:ferredoxin oxidoreductase beta subunit
MGGNDSHTIKAFLEAESYDGPSLIIAYSHCIAHGYDMVHGLDQQKAAVQSGYWPLFRLRSASGGRGQESVPARFAPSQHQAEGLRLQRDPLHHAGQEPSRRSASPAGTGAEGCARPLEDLRKHGQYAH